MQILRYELIQLKYFGQNIHITLFIKYVVLTFESVDEILWCYHSNETSSALLSNGNISFPCFESKIF